MLLICNGENILPVAVRVSKTRLLKLPKFAICGRGQTVLFVLYCSVEIKMK